MKTTIGPNSLLQLLSSYFNELKLSDIVFEYLANPFISTWIITRQMPSISLPLEGDGGLYDFIVEWGDGTPAQHITSSDQPECIHTYAETGRYTIHLNGTIIDGFSFRTNQTSCKQIVDISQWGCVGLGSKGSQFRNCINLNITAVDAPNLTLGSGIHNLSKMFQGASKFDGDLSGWETSLVTNMSLMFHRCSNFTGKGMNNFNTSNVTNMGYLFWEAIIFNGDVSKWDTKSVQDMGCMFYDARVFNSDISGWNIGSVTDMRNMFRGALAFKHDYVKNWNSCDFLF